MEKNIYRLEHLTEILTEEGISEIEQFIKQGDYSKENLDTLTTFLLEVSPWFTEECIKFHRNFAAQMVKDYLIADGRLDYLGLSEER